MFSPSTSTSNTPTLPSQFCVQITEEVKEIWTLNRTTWKKEDWGLGVVMMQHFGSLLPLKLIEKGEAWRLTTGGTQHLGCHLPQALHNNANIYVYSNINMHEYVVIGYFVIACTIYQYWVDCVYGSHHQVSLLDRKKQNCSHAKTFY